MTERRYIACDLGAESCRVMIGCLSGGRLSLEEIHRFPTPQLAPADSTRRWDVVRLFMELKAGIRKACSDAANIQSVSVDSWGVDYAVLGGDHQLLWPPFHYRDPRTQVPYEQLRQSIGEEAIYRQTGVQFLPINTLYQLAADKARAPSELRRARTFLTIADYFNFLLGGSACVDESSASTTQLYDPLQRQWAWKLIEQVGLEPGLFPRIVPPGTVTGSLQSDLRGERLSGPPPAIIATCSHDTGAAVLAVPASANGDWAYLSSGTWSLLGVELDKPLLSETARRHNYTNEAGFGGTTRFLRNIIGLWIVQELRRAWAADGNEMDYAALMEQARAAEPFRSMIFPNDARFAAPGEMPAKVAGFCSESGQPVPRTPGEFVRCVLESLALLYRATVQELETITGRRIAQLHVVGGGSKSELLNQLTADAIDRPVIAGPTEASAIGNVLAQAIALKHLASIEQARQLAGQSFALSTYQPSGDPRWQEACQRFDRLKRA